MTNAKVQRRAVSTEKDDNTGHSDQQDAGKDSARIQLSRFVLTKPIAQNHEKSEFNFSSVNRRSREWASKCCSPKSVGRSILSFFPVLTWFPNYPWKENLLPDFLAGLTVGIMSIPQGMAYARIAGMPPVYGLYTNIIPTFVYFLLGTTKHAAIGPATVLSLITNGIRYKHIPCADCWTRPGNASNSSLFDFDHSPDAVVPGPALTPIEVGSAVAFLAGLFLILMGIFRLSFIAHYLPDVLVGGFTVAAAVQVFTCQLRSIFGLDMMPHRNGIGKVLLNYADLFSLIQHTNLVTFGIFVTGFAFLIFCKLVVNPRFQRKLKIPFPGEFIVMAVATIVSHFAQFEHNYDVATVKHIHAGMPRPSLPKLSIMGMLAGDSFVLAIVTYTYSISLAKLYAKRNGYRVEYSQEFFAYGFMNLVGSFFQCFNSGQSVARSLVYEMAGAKSQLCGMFGTIVVILTVLFIAPFLQALPNAALASIIVAACLEMLHNLKELPSLFRKSKNDFAIFVVTLISTIVLDVMFGLAVSIAFALITVILRSQQSHMESITEEAQLLYTSAGFGKHTKNSDNTDCYHDFWSKVLVLRPTSPIFYVNAEKVKNYFLEKFLTIPEIVKSKNGYTGENGLPMLESAASFNKFKQCEYQPEIIILDMSSVTFIDLMGVNTLKEIQNLLKKKGISLYLSGCTAAVTNLMNTAGFMEIADTIIFPSLLDAVTFARHRLDALLGDDSESESMVHITTYRL